ncbi:MAG: ABC transporter substrate-binding protein [Dehalococcoidia bacterium]
MADIERDEVPGDDAEVPEVSYWDKLTGKRLRRRQVLAATAVTGAGLAGLALVGCGDDDDGGGGGGDDDGGDGGDGAQDEEPLVVATPNTPPKADPPFINQIIEHELISNTYDGLFEFKSEEQEDGTFRQFLEGRGEELIEASLAESWEVSDDNRTWTVKLREGVMSAYGNELTTEDVRWTFERTFALEAGFFLGIIEFSSMDNFEVVDDYTFNLTTDNPNILFFPILGLPHTRIQDSTEGKTHITDDDPWAAEWFNTHTAGFGAYNLTEATPGQQYVLEANPDYWRGAAPIKTVVLREVPDSSNRLALVRGGDADIAEKLTVRERQDLEGAEDVTVLSFEPSNQSSWLAMTNTIEPFNDVRVRQAISYALPYEQILETVTLGTGRQQKSPLPAPYRYYNDSFWNYETDLDRARELLAEAGLEDGFETTLGFSTASPEDEQTATLIQAALAELNITVTLDKAPFATFVEKWLGAQYPMVTLYLGAIVPDAAYSIRLWFYFPNNALDFVRYDNPDVNDMLDELRNTFDEARAEELTNDIQQQIVEDAPVAYMVEPGTHYAVRSNVTGVSYFTEEAIRFNRVRRT